MERVEEPEPDGRPVRSDVATDNPVPEPPFWGSRVVKGVALAEYSSYLDERATFMGQWGLRGSRGDGPSYDELVETEGRPRLRMWLDRIHTEGLLEAAVVYGYFPAVSEGNDLVVLHHDGEKQGEERARFSFPRQTRDRRLCLADFFRSRESGETDVVAFHLVTMGGRVGRADREALRRQRLPRLPRAARPLGPADRGAGRDVARPDPRGAVVRGGRRPGPRRDPAPGVPRLALLVRLPGLPGPG